MKGRYCSSCVNFSSHYSYCKEFKIRITSIGNAEVCGKYTTESTKEKKVVNLKKCKDCKNLFFGSYCKEEKINIKNIYKSVQCDKFIDKTIRR